MEKIEISDQMKFIEKLNTFKIKNSNYDTIMISDFDYTLSERYYNGKEMFSTYCFIDQSDIVNQKNSNFISESQKLKLEYLPIETNIQLDFEYRKKKIKEWFIKALDLYVNLKFSKEELNIMIQGEAQKNNFIFRKGLKELFQKLINYDIPIIIISGGLEKPIDIMLESVIDNYHQLKEKNKIILLANSFLFDENGIVNGYSKPVIYTFNKEDIIKDEIQKKYPNVNKVFIMGDHLNDYDSIKGLNLKRNNIIGIGFINLLENERKEKEFQLIKNFKEIYDITIINGSFLYLIQLLDLIYKK
jgi:HAD superfamily hydrolase (TIGR01544 family)